MDSLLPLSLHKFLDDIAAWKAVVPAALHPMRAFSIVRTASKISTQKFSEKFKVSRTYIAALENYHKPITGNFFSDYIFPIAISSESELDTFWQTYFTIIAKEKADNLFSTVSWLEKVLDDTLAYMLAHCIFQALSTLPFIDVVWENPLRREIFDYLIAENVKWPASWPERRIPRLILAAAPKSMIFPWLAGIIASDDLLTFYDGNRQLPSQVLMQRKFSLSQINTSALIALAIFLFDAIVIEAGPAAWPEPVQLSAIFKGEKIMPPAPGVTWFTIEDLIRLKDVSNMFED